MKYWLNKFFSPKNTDESPNKTDTKTDYFENLSWRTLNRLRGRIFRGFLLYKLGEFTPSFTTGINNCFFFCFFFPKLNVIWPFRQTIVVSNTNGQLVKHFNLINRHPDVWPINMQSMWIPTIQYINA